MALVLLCFWFLPLELMLASREKQMREEQRSCEERREGGSDSQEGERSERGLVGCICGR